MNKLSLTDFAHSFGIDPSSFDCSVRLEDLEESMGRWDLIENYLLQRE